MFAYLRIKHIISRVFDLTNSYIDDSQFVCEYWSASAYGEFKEELPPNAPHPKGIGFTMRECFDYNHAGELTTH